MYFVIILSTVIYIQCSLIHNSCLGGHPCFRFRSFFEFNCLLFVWGFLAGMGVEISLIDHLGVILAIIRVQILNESKDLLVMFKGFGFFERVEFLILSAKRDEFCVFLSLCFFFQKLKIKKSNINLVYNNDVTKVQHSCQTAKQLL